MDHKKNLIKEGHVVRDFYIGNTHIQICDDYCRDKTPEEVQAILDRIASNAVLAFTAALNSADS